MLTTRPHLRCRMPGTKAALTRNVPSRLIESTLRQSAKVISAKFLLREDAGAVDHDVDVAEFGVAPALAMAATDASDDTSHCTAMRLAAGGFHQLHGLAAVDEVDDRDMHAVLGQPLGERLPDAVGGAGDDGDFVFVTFGHFIPRVLFCHPGLRAARVPSDSA